MKNKTLIIFTVLMIVAVGIYAAVSINNIPVFYGPHKYINKCHDDEKGLIIVRKANDKRTLIYTFEEGKEEVNMKLKLKGDNIKALYVNNEKISPKDYSLYQKFIDELLEIEKKGELVLADIDLEKIQKEVEEAMGEVNLAMKEVDKALEDIAKVDVSGIMEKVSVNLNNLEDIDIDLSDEDVKVIIDDNDEEPMKTENLEDKESKLEQLESGK